MKHQFKIATTMYILQASDKPTHKEVSEMSKCLPDTPWYDLWDLCTPEYRLQLRIASMVKEATKKSRKPSVRADSRVYPRWGATASTSDYVREYHLANGNVSAKAWVKEFYQPLSEHVTVAQGEYSEELCST